MPPRKYNATRAACMFCECEPCECEGPKRAGPKRVDLTAVLGKPLATTSAKPAPIKPAVIKTELPVEEPPAVETPVVAPRHSPGKLTSARQQQSTMPARSGLAKVTREVVEDNGWHDSSVNSKHEITIAEAIMNLINAGMLSIGSMIEHKSLLGLSEMEANKLIWRIGREQGV